MSKSVKRNTAIALLLSLLCFVNASVKDESEPDLLIANHTGLYRIKIHNTDSRTFLRTDLPTTSIITAIDYHRSRNLVFWIDNTTQRIHSRSLDINDQPIYTVAEKTNSEWEPTDLAVDFIGDVLYVVDALGRKIEVYDLENPGRGAVIVANGLDRPIGIALDPYAGLMFIVDIDRIMRMNMDGGSSIPIISKSIESVISSLTIDRETKKIYWYDSDLKIIESSSYIGDSVKIVHRIRDNKNLPINDLTSLSFFNQLYFLTDAKSVYRIDVSVHKPLAEKFLDNFNGSSLQIIRPAEDVDAFPCRVANCQHMCLLNSQSERRRCICPINQVLKSDENNCQRVNEILLYSQKEVIKGRILEPLIYSSSSPVVASVTVKRSHPLSIDFDYARRRVYFADANSKKIYGSDIKTGQRQELTSYQGQASIAVDWLAQNLYYTDFVAGTLCVVNLRNSTNHKCLLDSLTGPRYVIAYPQNGQVFFLDNDKIKRINADGTNLTTVHTPFAHKVLGLMIDRSANRFYWLQTDSTKPNQVRIHNSDLEGWDEKSVEAPLLNNCVGGGAVTIKDNWIYAVCENYERLVRINKTSGKQLVKMTSSPDRQGFFALAVFAPQISTALSEQLQYARHPCLKNNGGCTNFCFAISRITNQTTNQQNNNLMRVCGCSEGQRLDDSNVCVNDTKPKLANHICETDWEYTCKNGRCIPKTQVCDGVNDCLDRSDEVDCPGYSRDFIYGR